MKQLLWRLIQEIGQSFSALAYPPLCLHCSSLLENHEGLFCSSCLSLLKVIDPDERCPLCFASLSADAECLNAGCHGKQETLQGMAAVFEDFGPASTYLNKFKSQNMPFLAEGAASFMALQFLELKWPMPDLLVPVPIARAKFLMRGYNQSRLLADALGHFLGRPVADCLRRKSGGFSQDGLSFEERLKLDENAFNLKGKYDLLDKKILLIDDLMGTRTTLKRCAETLLEGFPESIHGLTFCCLEPFPL